MARMDHVVRQFHIPENSQFIGKDVHEVATKYGVDIIMPEPQKKDNIFLSLEAISVDGLREKVIRFMVAALET